MSSENLQNSRLVKADNAQMEICQFNVPNDI
jgi:hypothetical protein